MYTRLTDMRYFITTVIILLCSAQLPAQNSWVFKGNITDSQQGNPIENACIHNISTGTATFSNEKGHFAMLIRAYDTLLVTHVGYAVCHIIVHDSLKKEKKRHDIRMTMKSIMLKGTTVYALKPYPIFLEDVAKTANSMENAITLSEHEKADATANPSPHLYTAHPISALYSNFSRKAKLDRMYQFLIQHEEEANRLSAKYNPEIVSRLSGLEGAALEDFMCYCSFSYYTLVKANDDEIVHMIIGRLKEYKKRNGE
jgi:hypothetical protein